MAPAIHIADVSEIISSAGRLTAKGMVQRLEDSTPRV